MKIPPKPPDIDQTLKPLLHSSPEKLQAVLSQKLGNGPYEHWDKIRFRKPPASFSTEEYWAAIKFSRSAARRTLPFEDKNGQPFHYVQIGDFQRALHEIDSNARGTIGVPGAAATQQGRDVYLQRSLIEEPFSSSVLEGAATTRDIAKRMIEEGRAPRTIDEQMVLNNYRAMAFIREHRHEPLTPPRVLEVHRILTEGTLERPEKCGVFRAADDDVRVVDSATDETLHMPPPASELPARLERLCEFANASSGRDEFLHPVIRAIVLHFMLSYDHPFWDGNGRCARALFYWCVLRHGYWLLEYVSISAIIRRAPVKYGMAFLYTETDEGDLTYFIVHQLDAIEQAIAELQKYLDGKSKDLRALEHAIGGLEAELNRRQLQVLQHALKNPNARYTIAEQQRLQNVSYLTARSDLEGLAERELLNRTKQGVQRIFTVPKNLQQRLTQRSR
jgi:Fic family protein